VIPSLRKDFLRRWTPEAYRRLLSILESECGTPVGFRVSETPCFLSQGLCDNLTRAGLELIAQLSTAEYRAISEASVPDEFRVPNEPPRPLFVQIDFGLIRNRDGAIEPRLVEIQGFPSLYAFQPALARAYVEAHGLDESLVPPSFPDVLARAILGAHAAENVILLEIDPLHQKTACDFALTRKLTGVKAVCVTEVRKRGRKLFYSNGGVETPVHRIYNRAIVDEQVRRGVRAGFAWTDDLDVEWAGHPNYYFRISKFSLPYLDHPTVPRTLFLDQVKAPPDDLDNWVLKPLYSFAGRGVVVGPSPSDLPADRRGWILQERCRFEPLFETPEGMAKAEIRVMYIWLGREPQAVSMIVRMGRGKMMGVDQNRNMTWVGASAALVPQPR